MIYFALAVLCGFLTALSDVLCKIYMQKAGRDAFFTLFLRWILSIPFLIPFLFSKEKDFQLHFLLIYALGIPLEILSAYLYMRSMEMADVSLVLPFQAITPALLPLTSFIILREKYSAYGIFGIIMVSVGSFFIVRTRKVSVGKNIKIVSESKEIVSGNENRSESKSEIEGESESEREKKNAKAILFMVVSAVIYSITSVFGRYMSQELDPEFFGSTYMITLSLGMTPLFIKKYRFEGLKDVILPFDRLKFLIGLSMGGAILTHFIALSGLETAYMISLKRTSVVFSVILGYLILGEGGFKERMLGSIFMFVGVIIIAFSI